MVESHVSGACAKLRSWPGGGGARETGTTPVRRRRHHDRLTAGPALPTAQERCSAATTTAHMLPEAGGTPTLRPHAGEFGYMRNRGGRHLGPMRISLTDCYDVLTPEDWFFDAFFSIYGLCGIHG